MPPPTPRFLKLLALGDSYTIGESVCGTCSFPFQLRDSLIQRLDLFGDIEVTIIARTGWSTDQLLTVIGQQDPPSDFDLVTLLIGVNNQFRRMDFEIYEREFPQLVDRAIQSAGGDANKLTVLSIPDYAFTPFGQSATAPNVVSQELDQYNAFAEQYCQDRGITYLNITDITRQGLAEPELVAADGLHPSTAAYSRFVARLAPIKMEKLD